MSGRLRSLRIAIGVSFTIAAMLVAPGVASAGEVEDAVKQVGDTVKDVVDGVVGGGGGASRQATPTPAQEEPEDLYQPPLHGTNPHGQGTVSVFDITPSPDLPYQGDPSGAADPADCEEPEPGTPCEDIVVGRSRGEQEEDDSYHGQVTLVALFGEEVLGIETEEGEEEQFNPLQTQVLDEICANTMEQLCVSLLDAESETDENGSRNSFLAAGAFVGGSGGLGARVAESNGNIEEDSDCQRAHGDSTIVDLTAGGERAVQAFHAETDSEACNDGSSTQQNDSSWIALFGQELGIPPGCETGEEIVFGLPPLVFFVCNADDTNGIGEHVDQAPAPYGVREAFNLVVAQLIPTNGDGIVLLSHEADIPLLKLTQAAAESHAVPPCPPGDPTDPDCPPEPPPPPPPPPEECPDPNNPDCPDGPDRPDGPDGPGPGGPGGPGGPTGEGPGDLPFTGADVLTLGMIGLAIIGGGVALMALGDRRRRFATGAN